MQCNSPASPVRRGGGKGAGWYTRLQAAQRDKGGMQCNSPASLEEGGGGKGAGWYTRLQAALNSTPAIKLAKYLIPTAILLLFLIAVLLSSCKPPATLTNNESHHARDSTYHATVHRIETHDTIVIGPSKSPLKGDFGYSPFKGEPEGVLLRISDRTITLHDTVYICRTDTLLRTQTITEKERYIPPFYRFCTITFATFATLAFSIHLLLRCKLPRLSCKEG